MVFSSTIFLFLFLPVTLALYYLPLPGRTRYRNTILLLASLLFYAWGEPSFIWVMLGMVAANWFCGLCIDAAKQPGWRLFWLITAITADIGILFTYKYLGFAHKIWLAMISSSASPIDIALPIGISFFTFQIMSYIIDLYRGNVKVQRRPDDLCLYVAMFPQLVAGPIVRYAAIAEAILKRPASFGLFASGVERFIFGLGKKVLLANFLAVMADNLFLMAETGVSLSAASAWLGIVAYALQIYFDFSGYSDMAIGLGRMFGFQFVENFNYPYAATSVTDFWRRWHISLSSWFRDYVYFPLGGSRCSSYRNTFNLFTVWALTGIWHGANWTFIFWGLLYFAALAIERVLGIARKKTPLMRVWTLLVVLVCWVFFRSSSITAAWKYLGMLFGAGGVFFDATAQSYCINGGSIIVLGLLCAFPTFSRATRLLRSFSRKTIAPIRFARACLLVTIFILSALTCVKATHNPFIYFNF